MRVWAKHNALEFPGSAALGFSDVIYVSVQLSTTFSSSDVSIVNSKMRNLVTVHSIAAFAYSTVIIAVFASLLVTLAS